MAFQTWRTLPCSVIPVASIASIYKDEGYDSLVLVAPTFDDMPLIDINEDKNLMLSLLKTFSQADRSFAATGGLIPLETSLKRLIYAPTGSLDKDYDDIRSYSDAAKAGVKRAVKAGSTKILLVVPENERFPNAQIVSLLGGLEALYLPYQYRMDMPSEAFKIDKLGFWRPQGCDIDIVEVASGLENGRFVARDLGGGDPEKMAPPAFADYVQKLFADSSVSVEIIDDKVVFEKEYPLFAAVNRAASVIDRHNGRIIFLKYKGEGPITTTLMPVGKGITYDTGGADIKYGGVMAGMSRDKCGAAAVAGFFETLNVFRPKHVKAIGALAVARNSVGEDCYVADEIIVSRAGVRIRIGNTDAEGRMVMTDLLCKLKELAVEEINPHLFTIATLTGHACLAVGQYTAVIDNGPAKKAGFAKNLQTLGESVGDMFEVSTIRREDFEFIKSSGDGEDLLQCNNEASSRTPRGHQFPAAFMIVASGLDKHGLNSAKPLKYSHFDIAGSSGHVPDTPTGVPIIGLAHYAFGDYLSKLPKSSS